MAEGHKANDDSMSTARMVADIRLGLLMVVALVAPTNPTWALRGGAVLAVFALVLALGQKRFRRIDTVALLFAAWAFVSISWATNEDVSLLGAQNLVACALLFVAVRVTVADARQLRWLAWAFVLGCFYGLFRLLEGGAQLRWSYDASAERIGIEGLNYNALAYALAVGAVLMTLLWAAKARPRSVTTHATLLGSWALLYAGIILSGTRGALLGAVALAAWFWIGRRFGPRVLILVLGGMLLVHAAAALGLLDRGLTGFFASDAARDAGDLSGRLKVWPTAREVVWERPIGGLGVDGIRVHPGNVLDAAAHNMVLDIASGMGFVGLALFLWIVLGAFREALSIRSDAALLVVGGYAVVIFPITLSGFWTEAPAFWLSLALISRVTLLAQKPPEVKVATRTTSTFRAP